MDFFVELVAADGVFGGDGHEVLFVADAEEVLEKDGGVDDEAEEADLEDQEDCGFDNFAGIGHASKHENGEGEVLHGSESDEAFSLGNAVASEEDERKDAAAKDSRDGECDKNESESFQEWRGTAEVERDREKRGDGGSGEGRGGCEEGGEGEEAEGEENAGDGFPAAGGGDFFGVEGDHEVGGIVLRIVWGEEVASGGRNERGFALGADGVGDFGRGVVGVVFSAVWVGGFGVGGVVAVDGGDLDAGFGAGSGAAGVWAGVVGGDGVLDGEFEVVGDGDGPGLFDFGGVFGGVFRGFRVVCCDGGESCAGEVPGGDCV